MSVIGAGLWLEACVVALALASSVLASVRVRVMVSGVLTCLAGVGGVVAGAGALSGSDWSTTLPGLLPLSDAVLVVDPLSGLFMTIVGGVAIACGVYAVGYPDRLSPPDGVLFPPAGVAQVAGGVSSRTVQAALPVFVAAMVLVPAAGNLTTFLLMWEVMALASLVLVLAEHRSRPEVARAGVWYAAMTQAGFVAILLSLVLLSGAAGSESFAVMRAAAPGMSESSQAVVFVLAFAGFGSKAGLVPLHVWLPRAHSEAPSYASALMSAAMVSLGLYGVLRVGFDILGGGPRWWWLLMLVVGAVSALFGVLQAMAATDFKRLLAYSTTENMGLIFIGVGGAGLFAATGDATLAGLLMVAALLHTVNHAAFKTLLFLGAGAVLRSTTLRDLDKMGGLARRMPVTAVLVGIGALAASGLPPGNGFVSEWLLLQGLIHSLPPSGAPDVAVAIAMPLAVGAVALAVGLGIATFVKAFGIGFLARPRSPEAMAATEVPGSMRVGMGVSAVACGVLAVAPVILVRPFERVLSGLPSIGERPTIRGDVELRLVGIHGAMSPLLVAVAVVGGSALVAVLTRVLSRMLGGGQPRRTALVWGCGGTRLSPRMQYTATAYAEPLTRVFDDVLRPEHDVDITHFRESRYLVESLSYRQRIPDRIENRLYPPLLAAANRCAEQARRLQNGSLHRYLAFGLVGLLVVLIAVGVTG